MQGEKDDQRDGDLDDPAAGVRVVGGHGQRRHHRGGEGAYRKPTRARRADDEQWHPDGDQRGEAVPVPQWVVEARLGVRDQLARDVGREPRRVHAREEGESTHDRDRRGNPARRPPEPAWPLAHEAEDENAEIDGDHRELVDALLGGG